MILDLNFIIIGTLIIISLIPLYIYKDKIIHLIYKKNDFNSFVNDIRIYLKQHYPKIKFDIQQAVEDTKTEQNPNTRLILVIENLIWQFINHKYTSKTKDPINKELLWSNYLENCKPNKDKLPTDWSKRKEFTWQRDKHICQRCGLKLKLDDAKVVLLKPIKDGGQYNFENLETLCNDCNKILKSSDLSKTAKSLNIFDNLMNKVKGKKYE